ncbi:GNAT family N-acetyltransferase [Chitinophaga sp. MD30]|uniref:GNAT family N-acetyltransferase n=1 Tax=Chitinophaga sp. MD30 TaxID=2033437 RepID=UPI000BAE9189|nr:GNAT family N-acetyltransferase [Chitinophaga sp. MD30]ASZ14089.1 hypothetical protein CK934_25635 [Chitinophaga sp. MD30]
MKSHSTLSELNIVNLTSLWQAAGAPFGANHTGDVYHYTQVADSDWPNRFWLKPGADNADDIATAITAFNELPGYLTFPYWDLERRGHDLLLAEAGLVQRFAQAGMTMPLTKAYATTFQLDFEQVTDAAAARLWADIYPKGFGYVIGQQIPTAAMEQIQFYLARYDGEPVGTGMLYNTGDIAGIHGIGVIPEMRRRGFAEEIMQFVINRALEDGARYAALQASQMGKGLYLRWALTTCLRYALPAVTF